MKAGFCETCTWFDSWGETRDDAEKSGTCRLHPPVFVQIEGIPGHTAHQPPVAKTGRCGEWRPGEKSGIRTSCGTCDYWVEQAQDAEIVDAPESLGCCMRFAPHQTLVDLGAASPTPVWPHLFKHQLCGEWSPRRRVPGWALGDAKER